VGRPAGAGRPRHQAVRRQAGAAWAPRVRDRNRRRAALAAMRPRPQRARVRNARLLARAQAACGRATFCSIREFTRASRCSQGYEAYVMPSIINALGGVSHWLDEARCAPAPPSPVQPYSPSGKRKALTLRRRTATCRRTCLRWTPCGAGLGREATGARRRGRRRRLRTPPTRRQRSRARTRHCSSTRCAALWESAQRAFRVLLPRVRGRL
jgi:hypothetical protein